ncbi:MAG: hypothetical protein GX885_11790 [Methanomicrobiales archaeon]|nr:hypothetical protein [Methanomicrobiales archaeon]
MNRYLCILLASAILLSLVPAGVVAQDAGGYVPDWSINLDGNITTIRHNDYAGIWYAGTDTGHVQAYDEHGNQIWDNPPIISDRYIKSIILLPDDKILVTARNESGDATYRIAGGTVTQTLLSPGCNTSSVVAGDVVYTLEVGANQTFLRGWDTTHNFAVELAGITGPDTGILPLVHGKYIVLSSGSTVKTYDTSGFFTDAIVSRREVSSAMPGNGTLHLNVHNTTGTASYDDIEHILHLYDANISASYGNLRFRYLNGTELRYNLSNVAEYATVYLDIPEPVSSFYLDVLTPYAVTTSASFSHTPVIGFGYYMRDDFSGDSLDTYAWNLYISAPYAADGNVTVSDGICNLATYSYLMAHEAAVQLKTSSPLPANVNISFRAKYIQDGYRGLGSFTAGETASGSPKYGVSCGYSQSFEISSWWSHDTTVWDTWVYDEEYHTYRYSLRDNGTIADVFIDDTLFASGKPVSFHSAPYLEFYVKSWDAENQNNIYIDWVEITGYAFTASEPLSVPVVPVASKSLTGTVVDIIIRGTHAVIQTDSRLYVQEIAPAGMFGMTTDLLHRTGAPGGLDAADDVSSIIEGRGSIIDIFRFDGARTGTYDTGGMIQDVYLSRKNGLYALGSSKDTKFYLFSKDESSSWYLLHASPTGTDITAISLLGYGDRFAIARGGTMSIYTSVQTPITESKITLRVYRDSAPYREQAITVLQQDDIGGWGSPATYTTDSTGAVVVNVVWGRQIQVIVGDNIYSTVISPSPAQAEYIVTVPREEPLRTYAQYRTWYDGETNRIYYTFQDTRGKTHRVVWEFIRTTNGTVAETKDFNIPDGFTGASPGFFQVPAGDDQTSYRVRLTVYGSPTYTNTWHQWVSGKSGIASLPGELSNTLKIGIFMVLLLFTGGIFSYFSGPHGAVVVSLLAGMLVFWGWLPVSPAVVALCIVWAFLGLLGRTGG